MARVRIPLVQKLLEVLAIVCAIFGLSIIFIACEPEADAAEVVLPIYVGEGAVTRPVVINPTAADIHFPDSNVCDLTGCHVVTGAVVKAHGGEIVGAALTPAAGDAGIIHLVIPDGLLAYAEIVTGSKALFFVDPLAPITDARFYNVAHEGPYNGFLFLGSDKPAALSLFGNSVDLKAGQAVVLSTPASGQFEIVGQLGTQFYVFAGINSQLNGSLQIIAAH